MNTSGAIELEFLNISLGNSLYKAPEDGVGELGMLSTSGPSLSGMEGPRALLKRLSMGSHPQTTHRRCSIPTKSLPYRSNPNKTINV